MNKRVVIIGAGFAGMSAAAYLAKAGYDVTVLERTGQPGGRAHVVHDHGYTFELGPSWYLMPDVFDEWFGAFGHKPSDFYELAALSPSYRIFNSDNTIDIDRAPKVYDTAEAIEPGAGKRLRTLVERTGREYTDVRAGLLELDGLRLGQGARADVLKFLLNPELARSYHGRIKHYVKNPDLQHALEFMTVFMGGSPHNIPAYYSLLAYVDMQLGGWYPMGGFGAVARAIEQVAREQGATFHYNTEVESIPVKLDRAIGVIAGGKIYKADIVISGADYHFTETQLLEPEHQSYTAKYWRSRQLSPSALLVTLGVSQKVPGLTHHNLFFDTDWEEHFDEVFKRKVWSRAPLFYLCAPSKTDPSVAPKGHENLFFLAPMAAGLKPTSSQLETTANSLISRVERATGSSFSAAITTKHIYGPDYFEQTFHALGGNAFGLSHTLTQSAVLRARMQSRRVPNLYYTGQYTNPGTGVPMVLLSGKVVSRLVQGHGR